MKVLRSKVIGFCFGVSNSIEKAYQCIDQAKADGLPCYSIGSIIHNGDVVRKFERLGMKAIGSPNDAKPGIAVVRAHGIPDADRNAFEKAGFRLVDSTCPIVARGASTLRKAAQSGAKTLIIGVEGHAETICLQGVELNGKPVDSLLVCSLEDAKALVDNEVLSVDDDIVVIVQTTFNEALFHGIRDYLRGHFRNIRFSNSPCEAPRVRIRAAMDLAEQVDAMIVVGGRDSENTKNLARLIGSTNRRVYSIENAGDLTEELRSELSGYETVGISSGSSTPTEVIKDVEEILRSL